MGAVSRRLAPEPHPCGVCGTLVRMAYPTCGADSCKRDWRNQSIRLMKIARRENLKANHPNLCRSCHKVMTKFAMEKGFAWCAACRLKNRKALALRREANAEREYVEKIALARADRLIRERARLEAEKEAEAQAYVRKKFLLPETQSIEIQDL